MTSIWPDGVDKTPTKTTMDPVDAMRILGWTAVYLAIVPPVAVILWRLATAPWP